VYNQLQYIFHFNYLRCNNDVSNEIIKLSNHMQNYTDDRNKEKSKQVMSSFIMLW